LERDSGRPEWEPFKHLCQQRFGPPFSTNHLAELARLPFTSTVEAYAELFQARAAHAGALTPLQKAQLFTGGLPEHIRADVELQEPQDLQRAVRLARAYERRNSSALLALPAPPPTRTASVGGQSDRVGFDSAISFNVIVFAPPAASHFQTLVPGGHGGAAQARALL